MTGVIIAVSVVGTICLFLTIFGAIKLHKMEKNMATLAECLVACMTNQERIDIVEDYPDCNGDSDFSFPNSAGF